jgi:dihydroflavonol-4-reductase|tara:strand:+ start:704 stop:1681 length:978 start_codon:yes stop_codon:yes gene_type:complete
MKAFVTGGSGHVGGNLVRELLSRGYQVDCLVRSDTRALDNLDVKLVKGDMLNPKDIAPLMTDSDIVFHSAAFVAVEKIQEDLMHKINVEGSRSIATAAVESGVKKMIHFSSVHAFEQQPTSESLVETRPLVTDPKALPYDRTKAEAQKVVLGYRDQGLEVNVIHPTGIIGPYDFKPSRMGEVLRDITNGNMPFAINNGFNWVDVRDVAKSAVNCVDMGVDGQNYILPGHWASIPHLSTMIKRITGNRTHLVSVPFWMAYLALPFASVSSRISGKRPSFSRGSLQALAIQCKNIPGTLANEHLDHQPRPLLDTIDDTVSWLTQNQQ